MKKIFLNGLVFGTAFCISIVLFYFLAKARTGTTATPGDKLTAAKRNELTTTVNTLQTQSTNQQTAISTLQTQMTALTGANWQTPTLLNGFTNYSDGDVAGYYKDQLNIVHLRGAIKSGSADVVIFCLPVGYRPNKTKSYIIPGNNASGNRNVMIIIHSDGNVYASSIGGPYGRLYLDTISFKAEQ